MKQRFPTQARVVIGGGGLAGASVAYQLTKLGWKDVLLLEHAHGRRKNLGVTNAGHYAINSLRLEKGYPAWGAELSPDDTPLEAGLGFAIDWNKPFLGREALLSQKQSGVKRRLVIFVLEDPEPVLWGSEPIYRDSKPVGYTTSGAYGHSVGGAIAMGYVNNAAGVTTEFIQSGRYEINVSGQRYPATAYLRAPYDPERKKIFA